MGMEKYDLGPGKGFIIYNKWESCISRKPLALIDSWALLP